MKPKLVFRPKSWPKWLRLKRVKSGLKTPNYNFDQRITWYKDSWKSNHRVMVRISGRLHYLGSHAPAPVSVRWRPAELRFRKMHLGVKVSSRYAELYTCDSLF